eukprot:353183-Chlamydomonas_euryale.AAC.13
MRVYVHYEEEGDPEHTCIVHVEPLRSATVGHALHEFVAGYNRRHGHVRTLDAGRLLVRSDDGRALDLGALLRKACSDRDDLTVARRLAATGGVHRCAADAAADGAAAPHAQPPCSTAAGSSASEQAAEAAAGSARHSSDPAALARTPPAAAVEPAAAGNKQELQQLHTLQAALEHADAAAAARNVQGAVYIYRQLLAITPKSAELHARLARAWLSAGRADRALAAAEAAVEASRPRPPGSEALQLLGEALGASGRHDEAVAVLERALDAVCCDAEAGAREAAVELLLAKALHAAYAAVELSDDGEDGDEGGTGGGRGGGGARSGCGGGSGGSGRTAAAPAATSPSMSASASARRVAALHQRCVDVVMRLVSRDESDGGTLAMYAQLALERGMADDALRVALRLMTTQRTHAQEGSELLATCLLVRRPAQSWPVVFLGCGGCGGKEMVQRVSAGDGMGLPATRSCSSCFPGIA